VTFHPNGLRGLAPRHVNYRRLRMNDAGDVKIEFKVNFKAGRRGRKQAVTGDVSAPTTPSAGSLPRVVRLSRWRSGSTS